MRVAIAAAMARSKREIPHYYLEHQVDVTALRAMAGAEKRRRCRRTARLLIGVLALKAVALACRRFPAFNGFYRDNKIEPSQAVHVGVAIAIRGGGLTAPALHDADQLSLDDMMARMRDLIQRTRAGRIRSSEISDPTITVSSLGERGVEALYGVIYPPQVAIVGFGKVVQRPWVVDGAIGPRSRGDHHACRRPPGERRPRRRLVPGRDRQTAAGARQAMSDTDIRKVVEEELNNIAPEVDMASVDPAADLREAIDIDSMDFLNFITAIHHRLGIDIPETRLSEAGHAQRRGGLYHGASEIGQRLRGFARNKRSR